MIGVFDSVLGGLSVLAALVEVLPQADFYADTMPGSTARLIPLILKSGKTNIRIDPQVKNTKRNLGCCGKHDARHGICYRVMPHPELAHDSVNFPILDRLPQIPVDSAMAGFRDFTPLEVRISVLNPDIWTDGAIKRIAIVLDDVLGRLRKFAGINNVSVV